jgi:DNA polymerase
MHRDKFPTYNELKDGNMLFITDDILTRLMLTASEISAHNAGFERVIWKHVMTRYGFMDLDESKLKCTAAKAAMHNLPRYLEGACKALDLPVKKDAVGKSLMLKLCKPRKATKGEVFKENEYHYHESYEDLKRLCEYALVDVEAEHGLDSVLSDLSKDETKVWELDQLINDRGIYIDEEGIKNLIGKIKVKEFSLTMEVQRLTDGFVISPTQTDNTRRWLAGKGYDLENLQKFTVVDLLKDKNLPYDVKRILEIRQSLSKTSTAKLQTFMDWRCIDGRVRGVYLYHGASTGRFSGRGPQTQNLPRDSYGPDRVESILRMNTNFIEAMYECVIQSASKCIRGMITSAPGKAFVCADFSAIEARVVAWLAGEQKVLDYFASGKDVYKREAAGIFSVKEESVNKDQRLIGKVAILSLGYQGWVDAFLNMAKNYGVVVDAGQAKDIIISWRKNNSSIVSYWHTIESAAIRAVKTGNAFDVGAVKFGVRGRFLHCRLPNGRVLSYLDPKIETVTTKYNVEKQVICFMGENSTTKVFGKQYTYGGKLVENITQAVARDLLVEGMFTLEKAGLPVVFHCHDEIVCEIPEEKATPELLHAFEKAISKTPAWAKGLPLNAEGWIGRRYRK